MTSVARLVDDLAGEGTHLERDGSTGALLVRSHNGRPVDPAIILEVPEEEFARLLAPSSEDAGIVFPDVDPTTAAYRIFLVNLEEELATKAMPGSRITIHGGGLRTRPERPVATGDLPGSDGCTWKAHRRP
ncbi:hypothetical protein [Modestobacter sp. I12A-02662]|uniref:hypothetical protein n=1 Tax=Modestobacter sp. I12A-02662 TaxID=1730496 RepID=UPI0034DE7676